MNIKCNQLADPYAAVVAAFLKREFPAAVKPGDSDLLDLLTEAIIASGQVRFGPRPKPESLVAVKAVCSYWVEKQLPIPFIIGFGSEKPDGTGVDIAELMSLKTIACLNARVKAFYAPGILAHIRVEDASAPHLFHYRQAAARWEAALYTSGMLALARVAGVSDFIKIIPEKTLVKEETFNKEADLILPLMEAHVNDPVNEAHRAALLPLGWTVPLNMETIGFFLDRYSKIYHWMSAAEQRHMLARYFAGAIARKRLNMTGVPAHWSSNFIEISFVQPLPGIDAARALRRIYYRTMPCSITSNHMPPWRAKGYLRINGEVSAALASFNALPDGLNSHTIRLSDGREGVDVQADYVVLP